jgi:hypothetical protein
MWPKLKTPDNMIKFLEKAEKYFLNRPTGGEDKAYWANEINASRCEEIIEYLKKETK